MSTARRAYDLLRGYVNSEWERLQGIQETDAERELQEAIENAGGRITSTHMPVTNPEDQKTQARKILGVIEGASFAEIREAYARLIKRSDPANFPAGSEESKQAGDIQRRVQWAFSILSEGMDPTDKRFSTLEIE